MLIGYITHKYTQCMQKNSCIFFYTFHSLWLRSTDAIRILRCKCCCKACLFISHNKLLDITWTKVHQRGSCYRYEIRCQLQRLVFFDAFSLVIYFTEMHFTLPNMDFWFLGSCFFFVQTTNFTWISWCCNFSWLCVSVIRWILKPGSVHFKSFDTNWIWRY